jgi:hypothetical protein
LPSFNPSFDRTNAANRFLIKGSANIGNDFSPEFLFYREGTRTKFGANMTRSLSQNIVAYAEWAGGDQLNVTDDAVRYGVETGTLPLNAPGVLPRGPQSRFQNSLSAGGSYTTPTKITFNLEYHFHQAGFVRQDWGNWFNAGMGTAPASPQARELWYIRGYALDQQDPLTRHSVFLRADWVDALIRHLEVTGFVNTDLYDGSNLLQIGADYYVSNSWTVGLQASANVGSPRSDFGSLPQGSSFLFKLARYF